MQPYTRQSWRILAIALLTFMVLSLTGCESIPDEAKPDVHLTFDIQRDGSNATILEVAVHPLVDPLLQPILAEIQQLIGEQADRTVDIKQTTREGRKYSALVLEFNSIADLNAFMNTPQLLNGIAGELFPEVVIPVPFAEFKAWHDTQNGPEEYGIQAQMSSKATSTLAAVNLTTHVTMPIKVKNHNGQDADGRTVDWKVQPGQPFDMAVQAGPTGLGGLVSSGLGPILAVVLGVVALMMAVLVAIVWRRRRHSAAVEPVEDWWTN